MPSKFTHLSSSHLISNSCCCYVLSFFPFLFALWSFFLPFLSLCILLHLLFIVWCVRFREHASECMFNICIYIFKMKTHTHTLYSNVFDTAVKSPRNIGRKPSNISHVCYVQFLFLFCTLFMPYDAMFALQFKLFRVAITLEDITKSIACNKNWQNNDLNKWDRTLELVSTMKCFVSLLKCGKNRNIQIDQFILFNIMVSHQNLYNQSS